MRIHKVNSAQCSLCQSSESC